MDWNIILDKIRTKNEKCIFLKLFYLVDVMILCHGTHLNFMVLKIIYIREEFYKIKYKLSFFPL